MCLVLLRVCETDVILIRVCLLSKLTYKKEKHGGVISYHTYVARWCSQADLSSSSICSQMQIRERNLHNLKCCLPPPDCERLMARP